MLKAIKRKLLSLITGAEKLIFACLKRKFLSSKMLPWTTGYNEYKYDFIGDFVNNKSLSSFGGKALPDKYGYRLDERVVEYPWFFYNLKDDERVILDAGSILNHRQILAVDRLKGRDLYIVTLADEGRAEANCTPSYIYGDLRDTCFKDEFFDGICCISTLEHVGLDNTKLYVPDVAARENDKYSHLIAISEMLRVLKPKGTLYLTLPFGIYKNHGWFQVFDSEMVNKIINTFDPGKVSATYFRYENDQWNFSSEEVCQDGYCFDIHATKKHEPDYLAFARCVVCLELTKKAS